MCCLCQVVQLNGQPLTAPGACIQCGRAICFDSPDDRQWWPPRAYLSHNGNPVCGDCLLLERTSLEQLRRTGTLIV
jgi:hypothetical protein